MARATAGLSIMCLPPSIPHNMDLSSHCFKVRISEHMRDLLVEFEWRTCAKGFEWRSIAGTDVTADDLASPAAVEAAWQRLEKNGRGTGPILHPRGSQVTTTSPMAREHATLFRTFAELDYRDPDVIREFANNHGLLGVESLGVKLKHRGESHLMWAREICRLRHILTLTARHSESDDAEERRAWLKYGLDPNEPSRARRHELDLTLNAYLSWVTCGAVLEPDQAPRLTLAPRALLAAMWLQFAGAIAGDKEFVACKFCGHYFERSPETGVRSHREFCKPSCKTMDYRRRKRTALRLAKKGTSVREIAQAVNTQPDTVRAWLSSVRTPSNDRERRRSR
jgi:hypothetical protein